MVRELWKSDVMEERGNELMFPRGYTVITVLLYGARKYIQYVDYLI
jgi:hypothetical protein